MKRVLLCLMALMAFSVNAHAVTVRTATMGDQNSSNVYRLRMDMDSATNAGFAVWAQDTGIYLPYTSATTTTTLTAFQTGTTMIFTGASTNTRFTLPTATVGMEYAFVNDTTNTMAVYPNTGDTINFASLATSFGLTNSSTPAKGDSLILFCSVAGKWSVKSMRNTWVSIAP